MLATLGLAVWAWGTFLRDPTEDTRDIRIGAAANFGPERAPVLPAAPVPLDSVAPIDTRDIGRYVRLRGVVIAGVRHGAAWVRAADGRRLLVRFEPLPPEGALRGVRPGAGLDVAGYVDKLALAEFRVWMDTLQVNIPRPPPGLKFGDPPDSSFLRVDSLFVKTFYLSVRPEGLAAGLASR